MLCMGVIIALKSQAPKPFCGSLGMDSVWNGPYHKGLFQDPMEIRNPNKTHLAEVHALLQRSLGLGLDPQAVADRIFYEEAYDPNHVWFARESGKMLGFLHTTLVGDEADIKLLVVAPERRRTGLGRDMLSRAEYRLSGEGAKSSWVRSSPPNEFFPGVEPASVAEAFFVSQGYAIQSEGPVHWAKPVTAMPADEADLAAAVAFAQAQAPTHWAWVEESLAARKALFDPAAGLCLAEPGESAGPLWAAPEAQPASLQRLAERALALASSKAPRDARGLRLHQVPGSLALPLAAATTQIHATLCKTLH
jgi:GNAT superfamily N-acetyltransferase